MSKKSKIIIIAAALIGVIAVTAAVFALHKPAEKPTVKSTTAAQTSGVSDTTVKKTKNVNPYALVIEDIVKNYGNIRLEINSNYSYLFGLCYAELIDFNGDGKDELYVVYGRDTDEVYEYCFEVWSVKSTKPVRLVKAEPYSTDGGVKNVSIITRGDNKYVLAGSADSFSHDYIYGFDGDEFKVVKSMEYEGEGDEAQIDGKKVSYEEFEKAQEIWLTNSTWYDLYFPSYSGDFNDIYNIIAKTKRAVGLTAKKAENPLSASGEIKLEGTLVYKNNKPFLKLANELDCQGVKASEIEVKVKPCEDVENDALSFLKLNKDRQIKVTGTVKLKEKTPVIEITDIEVNI